MESSNSSAEDPLPRSHNWKKDKTPRRDAVRAKVGDMLAAMHVTYKGSIKEEEEPLAAEEVEVGAQPDVQEVQMA
ncbi:hypothetical protein AMTR_s00012p00139600 [Amborella trichopoda]|uniref:Uncharacterized protein n=1 Tax=Amborella trichopoda TaxID=13333 RepID=W1PKY2_AMBTC|nr:hypothetical protein AMTR_s00012p00139600 [Amborella trichopoda]